MQLTLPPVVHGRVEHDPATLGGLSDMLKSRGVDLLQALKDSITERVGGGGVSRAVGQQGDHRVAAHAHTRAVGQPAEHVARRGYALSEGVLKLGALAGSLFTHDEKYFRESNAKFLGQPPQDAWSAVKKPIEVLRGLDRQAARK